jgi:uncharacterized protein (DUF433 family)
MAMTAKNPEFLDRIVQDPEIMVGKPVIKGTRIPVATILTQLAYNPDLDELFAAYPRLTIDDVRAALAFASASVEETSKHRRRTSRRSTAPATA